jgi:hypothetical protein
MCRLIVNEHGFLEEAKSLFYGVFGGGGGVHDRSSMLKHPSKESCR